MIKVDVFIQEKKWKKYIANPQKYLKNRTNKIRNLIPLLKNKKIVFSILLAGNMEIKKLNKKFRKKNKITDILSFPFYRGQELKKKIRKNKNIYLGDIILNYHKIHKLKKRDFIAKFNELWVHGFLHLIGHKHYKNKDFYKMSKLENQILSKVQNIR
tara:strand:+ start:30 stop:500 length:471 start_codon:yes stop_codon:yes gene_type:complete